MTWLANLFMGAHWPVTELDFAGTDLATSARFLFKVRKQRNNPAAGYDMHRKAFRDFLIFLVALGLSLLATRLVPQPWVLLGAYALGSVLHALVPPTETFQERMAAIAALNTRNVSWVESITRDFLLRFLTGVVWGQLYFFGIWLGQFGLALQVVVHALFWACLVWEVIGIFRRESIRRQVNRPLR